MRRIVVKRVCFIGIIISAIVIIWLGRYIDRGRYIENILDIEIRGMIDEIDGIIKPGGVLSPESMFLKVWVKKSNEEEFITTISKKLFERTDLESVSEILNLNDNECFMKYANEIRQSELKQVFFKFCTTGLWSRTICIFVTEQEGKKIVYFLDEY